MKKVYTLLLALFAFGHLAQAQSQLGEIRGRVIDSKSKKPLDYVSVSIFMNGVLKANTLTDDDGNYVVKTLPPGEYEVKVSNIGYNNSITTKVAVTSDEIQFVNVNMDMKAEGQVLKDVIIERKKPLVDPEGKGGGTVTAKEVLRLPVRNANSIAGTFVGVDTRSGGTPNFRGARADGTAYYIDGVRVNGNSSIGIPTNAIDQIQVITGGTPAQYGDFIGGAISISTKAPSKQFMRTFEYITASPFYGYLDNTHYNNATLGISGPVVLKDKGKADKERVLVGFSVYGSGTYALDARPSVVDLYKVKDEKQKEINEHPLTRGANGGFVNSSEFLTRADMEKVPQRQNVEEYSAALQGNFTYAPVNNMNLRLGYMGNYFRGRDFNFTSSLMNSERNALRQDYTFRTYLQFTQSFSKKSDEESKKSLITNAFYSVRFSYEIRYAEVMDKDFQKDFFKYGYIGKFKTYSRPSYTRVFKGFGDSADVYTVTAPDGTQREIRLSSPYYRQEATAVDTLTTYEQADINRVKGNYTRTIFDYYRETNQRISSVDQILGQQGLINGYEPNSIYSRLWSNAGGIQANYSKFRNETYTLYVMSEASVGSRRNTKNKHDLQFGFTYEQQVQRSYGVAANSLWILMRQLTNNQFGGNDSSRAYASFDANGVFQDTVRFDRLIVPGDQSSFDRKLRDKLIKDGATDVYGNKVNERTVIDVNNYSPETYSLDMFTADELLNDGVSSRVNYYGYDYLGNPVSGKPGIDRFFNDKQMRTIGAFQPVYMAAWAQDKFVFKDLILRLGVRMERFDANQVVLKDPYSVAPIYTAGDVRQGNLKNLGNKIPGSIGDDFKVYVDNEKQEGNLNISGFRHGNDWYDANGNPVTDPSTLYKNSNQKGATISQNTPFLINAGQKRPDASSFTDYVPDVKFLPRVWFSFPISTTSQFFATFDVLAQRPTGSLNVLTIDDYYFMSNRLVGVFTNPDLKMTQVTDYQIGFTQQVGDNSAIKIQASYREFRNLLQQYRYVQAWPYDYTTYGNLDFSTVKAVSVEYNLIELGNVNLTASYQLQFADGTGSNANSSSALVQVGLPTLRTIFPLDYDTRHTVKTVFDYHYREGKEYDGPVVGGKKILENAGVNLIFIATSGRPYTQIAFPIATVQPDAAQRTQTKGSPMGSNLPAQFTTDLNIDKYFNFEKKHLVGPPTVFRTRIFLNVQNLFNVANVLSVYQYTGSAYSDGYINSPNADAAQRNATSSQAFVDLYNTRLVNPNNFTLPRTVRLGLSMYF
jgi:hypothetical protein